MSGNSFAVDTLIIFSDAESDCSVIGNQAVLFCDLCFPNRHGICLKIPGAWFNNAAGRSCSFLHFTDVTSSGAQFYASPEALMKNLWCCVHVVYYVLQD